MGVSQREIENRRRAAGYYLLTPLDDDNLDWIDFLPLGQTMRFVQTHLILETLKLYDGNRSRAAKALGISLRMMRNRLHDYVYQGFDVPPAKHGGNFRK